MANTDEVIIGIDHGYKNMKTRSHIFEAKIYQMDAAPDDKTDILEFNDMYFDINDSAGRIIPQENKNKADSEEFYLLTFAAIAKELDTRKITPKKVHIAVGLPAKYFARQKDAFKEKLLSKPHVKYAFNGNTYEFDISGVDVFMQGLAAIIREKEYRKGDYVLCDIGGGTVDVLPISDGHVDRSQITISGKATIALMKSIVQTVDEDCYQTITQKDIINAIKVGNKAPQDEVDEIIQRELRKYSNEIFKLLKENDFNLNRINIIFIGGGASIIKEFGDYITDRTFFVTDMKANAIGYEYMSTVKKMRENKNK